MNIYRLYAPDPWYDEYVNTNQSQILDVGPTGFAGTTGWYIPTYLMSPSIFGGQLDYWRMYRLPEVAAFFTTAATNYSTGEWAGGYSSWGPEVAMLQNLRMNFTAIWYGDGLLDQLTIAYAKKAPIFMYLWTPLGVSLCSI